MNERIDLQNERSKVINNTDFANHGWFDKAP